jgi:hypothetical protein
MTETPSLLQAITNIIANGIACDREDKDTARRILSYMGCYLRAEAYHDFEDEP